MPNEKAKGRRIDAVVLAADAAWCEASITSYYTWVDKIWISHDCDRVGWTGKRLDIDAVISRMKSVDKDGKMRLLEGKYHGADRTPMEWETAQRQFAIDEAHRDGAEWVLNLDTDEIVPQVTVIARILNSAPLDCMAISWPLRAFFNEIDRRNYLEVCGRFRNTLVEYIPIIFKAGVTLDKARRTKDAVHHVSISDERLKDVVRFMLGRHTSDDYVSSSAAILHMSWVRSYEEILRKVTSWGHANDFNGEQYANEIWRDSKVTWKRIRNFHPMYPKLWPRLRISEVNISHDLNGNSLLK